MVIKGNRKAKILISSVFSVLAFAFALYFLLHEPICGQMTPNHAVCEVSLVSLSSIIGLFVVGFVAKSLITSATWTTLMIIMLMLTFFIAFGVDKPAGIKTVSTVLLIVITVATVCVIVFSKKNE